MKEINLTLKEDLRVPLDMSSLTDVMFEREDDVRKAKVQYGNRMILLDNLFDIKEKTVEGTGDLNLILTGNFTKARRIGYRLKKGSVTVEGDGGHYVGEEMFDGHIKVMGNVGSWLGSKMSGGAIEVMKGAGDFIGSSYKGSREGMKGGTVIVHGSVGDETGCWMRGGIIEIKGNAGLFPGVHMSGGGILVEGVCSGRAGAQMTSGTVIIMGKSGGILPSFSFQDLKKKAKIKGEKVRGPFYLFSGDVNENGEGRLYLSKENNPDLSWNERYLEVIE